MPTREVLSPSQRAPFIEIPAAIGERELARYYRVFRASQSSRGGRYLAASTLVRCAHIACVMPSRRVPTRGVTYLVPAVPIA